MQKYASRFGLVAVAFLGGCASTLVPTGSMETSLASIRAAEEVGAVHVPQAKLHRNRPTKRT